MVLTTELYKQFPESDEGDLTQFRASLIRGESLAEMAEYIGLQNFIYLSPSEKNNNGHMRSSTLEDAIEALIGAIYLDGGIESHTASRVKLGEETMGSFGTEIFHGITRRDKFKNGYRRICRTLRSNIK